MHIHSETYLNQHIYIFLNFTHMYSQWAKLHHPYVLRPAEAVAVPHGTIAGGTRHWGSTPSKLSRG